MGVTAFQRVRTVVIAVTWACLLAASAPGTIAADDSGGWHFTLQPYLWAPTIEMDLKLAAPNGSTGEPEIEIEPDDYLENLDLALIVTAMARKGKWSFTTDFIFMEVSSEENQLKSIDFGVPEASTSVGADVDVDVTSFITTFGAGYQAIDGPRLKMDLVAGLRYLWMEQDVDWDLEADIDGPGTGQFFTRSGSVTEDGDAWNGVGGVRGEIFLGSGNWFIPFYADIGTGDSDLTWSLFGGIGYSFMDWFDVMIGYRHMEWDNDDEVIQKVRLSGPLMGARFNF
ncbi:hypothetical protein DSCW_22570 [Desulfosarcina widdelii]|uniref:Outer membrane protein beta-barrel domain-containing protein n=1 Tax=Desulfosarcina widdelii TaxID=947919 RepID=A0A5K7Z2F7_9BACT|nr:hypothetical protein [Desulfosarcina widdelii]BBO74840.1 hypothetical protein DSCW_22570 [Desulfosarcina widdelii]